MKLSILFIALVFISNLPSFAIDLGEPYCTSEIVPAKYPAWCPAKLVDRELPPVDGESFFKFSKEILSSIKMHLPRTTVVNTSSCVFKIGDTGTVTKCFVWDGANTAFDALLGEAIQHSSFPRRIPANIRTKWMKVSCSNGNLTLFVDLNVESKNFEKEAYFEAVRNKQISKPFY